MATTEELTPEQKKGYREQFEKGANCVHCGGLHLRACRRVKRIVPKNKDEIAEVEFWQDGFWDETGIVWPEDVYDEEDDGGSKGKETEAPSQEGPDGFGGKGPASPVHGGPEPRVPHVPQVASGTLQAVGAG